MEQKEENIAKKVLLDICYREIEGKDSPMSSIELREINDPLINKITQMMIGKSGKYPKDGPHLNKGEQIKLQKFEQDFK
jgi:hypothetical protein